MCELVIGRQLGLITLQVHQTQEPEWFPKGGAELVPGERRYCDQIVEFDLPDAIAHQAMAASPQDHDGMGVMMPLEGGKATRGQFEIPQLSIRGPAQKRALDVKRTGTPRLAPLRRQTFDPLPSVFGSSAAVEARGRAFMRAFDS